GVLIGRPGRPPAPAPPLFADRPRPTPCRCVPSLLHLRLNLDAEHLALWLLHRHARNDLAGLTVHHRIAGPVASRAKSFFDLCPIWRLLDLDEPDLPGVGEELLLIASVTHLRRPNL